MFSVSSTVLQQFPCCPGKQGKLSEKYLQNLLHKKRPVLVFFFDKIVSVGLDSICIRRVTYQYNLHVGAPLSVDATPRPSSAEEVWRHATEERFEAYQASSVGGIISVQGDTSGCSLGSVDIKAKVEF